MDNVVPTGVAGVSPHALSGSALEHHTGMLSQESVVRSARAAARHGWENVHVVHAADGDDNRRVPDLGTLIGAYKQVARMGDAAGRVQGRGSAAAARSGRSAATLEQAADSLDAIAASMGHRGHLNPVGHARGESAWDRDHPMMLQRGRVEAGGNDDRGEARMVQEQHHSLMEEHVLSHTAMLRPINLVSVSSNPAPSHYRLSPSSIPQDQNAAIPLPSPSQRLKNQYAVPCAFQLPSTRMCTGTHTHADGSDLAATHPFHAQS